MHRRISLVLLLFFTTSSAAQNRFDAARLLTDLRTLSSDDFEGRDTGTPGGILARDYIASAFDSIGMEACGSDFLHQFMFVGLDDSTYEGTNVIGLIPGAENPDLYLVVTAHYDHVGIRNGEIYNGADDNASGAAALVAVANHFLNHRPAHSIVIAAFDAEEKGLWGAQDFINDPCVPKDGISMNVNMDMISRSAARELYVAGTGHYPELLPLLSNLRENRPLTLLFGHDTPGTGRDDWTYVSDHGPFHREGIPFVVFSVEEHPGYHRPGDDFEYIDAAFYLDAVDVILDALVLLDRNLEAIRLINER